MGSLSSSQRRLALDTTSANQPVPKSQTLANQLALGIETHTTCFSPTALWRPVPTKMSLKPQEADARVSEHSLDDTVDVPLPTTPESLPNTKPLLMKCLLP